MATGSLQVCPDTTVRLTCSHDSVGDLTRWEIGPTIDCTAIVAHTTNPGDATCASFTVNMVSDSSQPTRVSTLVLPLEQSLNGAVVTCYAGGTRSNPQVGNLTIQFISEMAICAICAICACLHIALTLYVNRYVVHNYTK